MLQQEIDSLVPSRELSRRRFVQTTVGSGFAAAVLPVSAQTIKTDSAGLTAGEVTIPVGDFKMPAYRAAPAGKVLAETRDASVVAGEPGLQLEPAARPRVHVMAGGGEVDEVLHGLRISSC